MPLSQELKNRYSKDAKNNKRLNVSMVSVDLDDLSFFLNLVKENVDIKEIAFFRLAVIDDQFVRELLEIPHVNTIETLDLEGARITDKMAELLAKTQIQNIYLKNTRITNEGAVIFVKNSNQHVLTLDNCEIDLETMKALNTRLTENKNKFSQINKNRASSDSATLAGRSRSSIFLYGNRSAGDLSSPSSSSTSSSSSSSPEKPSDDEKKSVVKNYSSS